MSSLVDLVTSTSLLVSGGASGRRESRPAYHACVRRSFIPGTGCLRCQQCRERFVAQRLRSQDLAVVQSTPGDVGQDGFIRYRARQQDCAGCDLRQRCTPNTLARKVTRSIHEGARDLARDIVATDAFLTSWPSSSRCRRRWHLPETAGMLASVFSSGPLPYQGRLFQHNRAIAIEEAFLKRSASETARQGEWSRHLQRGRFHGICSQFDLFRKAGAHGGMGKTYGIVSILIHAAYEADCVLGDSLDRLRDFPYDARSDAGHQLNKVQNGNDPDDWKPMKTVGPGLREIRIREDSGAFRIIYLATLFDAVLVLNAFQKKTQATPQRDIDLAASRLRA